MSKKTKIIIGAVAVLFVVGIATSQNNEDSQNTNTTTVPNNQIEQSEEIESTPEPKTDFLLAGKEEFETGEYLYIKKEDLYKYAPNMKNVKIYIDAEIKKLQDEAIKVSLDKGYMFSTFNVGKRFDEYKENLKEGDRIIILGTVEELSDYGVAGNSISLKKCYVCAVGDDVDNYIKEKTDKGLNKYFKATEQVAEAGTDLSKKEYKALCKTYKYKSILRKPDKYDGKYCKVSGEINQVVEGIFDSYTLYIKDSSGNIWGTTYSYNSGEEHRLEGDKITVYGKCKGTDTTTNLLGKQITMPRIDAEYID